jgi:hypothetical protein
VSEFDCGQSEYLAMMELVASHVDAFAPGDTDVAMTSRYQDSIFDIRPTIKTNYRTRIR